MFKRPYQHVAKFDFRVFRNNHLICIFLFFILMNGCHKPEIKDKISQGVITFDISYTSDSGRNFPVQLLPKNMEMKFNKNYTSFTIEDRVGLFSISNITNLKKRHHVTLIKVFDKKYVFKGDTNEAPIFFRNNVPYEVKLFADTARLVGILCQKASVTDVSTRKSFDVFYTSNIDLQNPNANTPYQNIHGLLLQFGIQMKNLKMKLTAKKINQKEIDNDEFIIPTGYKRISKNQMEEIINTLLP
jgi:hypothetical protein